MPQTDTSSAARILELETELEKVRRAHRQLCKALGSEPAADDLIALPPQTGPASETHRFGDDFGATLHIFLTE